MQSQQPIIIIGAGLTGVYIAWRLRKKKQEVILLEARERTGGRILSTAIDNRVDACVDMGPAWVWPDLQPRLNQLVAELGIKLFKQFTDGDMLYERDAKNIERYSGQSSHNQSYRIAGGARALIDVLQSQLPISSVHLGTQVRSIDQTSVNIEAVCDNQSCVYSASKIILALPPRLIQQNILFNPSIDNKVMTIWENTPTWMSSHCKIIFIYETAFWREQGFSGEVFSQHGPLTEIYDGSPNDESFYALTSFVGLNANQREQIKSEQLIKSCLIQLQRLFGDACQNIKDIQIKDWSQDQNTSSKMDYQMPPMHPQYPENAPRSFCNNQIILAGTEVAREHGGYLEGALESADEALLLINSAT
jgi:monoamine oxidase